MLFFARSPSICKIKSIFSSAHEGGSVLDPRCVRCRACEQQIMPNGGRREKEKHKRTKFMRKGQEGKGNYEIHGQRAGCMIYMNTAPAPRPCVRARLKHGLLDLQTLLRKAEMFGESTIPFL